MRKHYIDYLRAVSIIGVITIHVTANFYSLAGEISQAGWWLANFLNAASRFSVPLFVMISGAVLLGRPMTTNEFYNKRAQRLIPPFLFWNLFYIALNSFRTGDVEGTISSAIVNGYGEVHLWYLTMFVCLMLFAPFINSFLNGNKPGAAELSTLLSIFFVFFLANGISIMTKALGTEIEWFKLFPWFIAYFVLGHFVDIHGEKIQLHKLTITALIVLLTLIGATANFYTLTSFKIKSDYLVLNNAGALVFLLSFFVYLLAQKNQDVLNKKNRIIVGLSEMSFGMYLIHPVFLLLLSRALPDYNTKPLIYIPLAILLTTLLSFLATAALRKNNLMRKIC